MARRLLDKAEKQIAAAKVGLLGFPKSGKTFTAVSIALGLARMMGSKKPIAFADSETGSDFMLPRIEEAGLDMLVAKTRSFKDLLDLIPEAEQECDVLIVDSVSAYWLDLLESYQIAKQGKAKRVQAWYDSPTGKIKIERQTLDFPDWNIIKPTWRLFTDLYLTSRLHIITCGRAGFEYDFAVDEETGKRELIKTGTKQKVESEFGFEPNLLIEMERVKEDRKFKHRAWVWGDRSMILDGKSFDDPTFEDFRPHFEVLNLGGEHKPIDTTRSSEDMFEKPSGRPEWKQREIHKKIALETVQETLTTLWPKTTADDKALKREMIERLFSTVSWTEVENMGLERLQEAAERMKRFSAIYTGRTALSDDYNAKELSAACFEDLLQAEVDEQAMVAAEAAKNKDVPI